MRRFRNRLNSWSRHAIFLALMISALPIHANPFLNPGSPSAPEPVRSGARTLGIIIQGQLELRNALATFFRSWKAGSSASGLLVILGISFLYGIVHALGPGHRKTVVFSIYLSRKAPWWEPLASAFTLSGLHGGSAIVLIVVFKGISGAVSLAVEPFALYMEGASYCILIVMAVMLLLRSILDLFRKEDRKADPVSLGTLLLTGVYPCPGAILVLILSLSLDILGIGILAVVAMSLGMSIPIALFAYLGWLGRSGVLRRLEGNRDAIQRAGTIIDIVGFTILLLFSVYIALPFLVTLSRLFS